MTDSFDLPVCFNNQELSFTGHLLNYGYSYKIELDVYGTLVFFEPDEERNFRALIAPEELNTHKKISPELLEAIVQSLQLLLK